jgi:hypothetical protein
VSFRCCACCRAGWGGLAWGERGGRVPREVARTSPGHDDFVSLGHRGFCEAGCGGFRKLGRGGFTHGGFARVRLFNFLSRAGIKVVET